MLSRVNAFLLRRGATAAAPLAVTRRLGTVAAAQRTTEGGNNNNGRRSSSGFAAAAATAAAVTVGAGAAALYAAEGPPMKANEIKEAPRMPVEVANLTFAPDVPPPIKRKHAVRMVVELTTTAVTRPINAQWKYPFWTYNDGVPGPFIRCRVGDVLEIRHTNKDPSGMAHNIDFHGVTGPGGGGPVLLAEKDETKIGVFKCLQPGLYIYHCAAAPVPMHVANGMYGLLLVEPENGLPPVDKEFYVVQSEFYGEPALDEKNTLEPSYAEGLNENPMFVVFNGEVDSLTKKPLMTKQGDKIRIFFGNAGPNKVSSFHVIGMIFDRVYREGDLLSPPGRSIQTTLVPAGGSCVVEFEALVPGNYTLVDHSIFRLDKGCVGFLKVLGNDPHKEVYGYTGIPLPCPGCKLHD